MTIHERIEKIGKAKLIGTHESGSKEWLEQRANTIGGSDIASIMHVSPFTSEVTLWARKSGLIADQPATDRMRLGNLFEPAIAQLYAEYHSNLTLHYPGHTWESVTNPRFHANPDGFIETEFGDTSILEIKYTSQYWATLPEHYRLQVMWYQHVTGLTNDAVVAAVTPYGYTEYSVMYDYNEIEIIEARVLEFLDLLDTKTQPELEGSASTYETIRELQSDLKDEEIEISESSYQALLEAIQQQKSWDSFVRLQKARVMREMQSCRWGYVDGKQVVSLRTRGEGKPYLVIEQE